MSNVAAVLMDDRWLPLVISSILVPLILSVLRHCRTYLFSLRRSPVWLTRCKSLLDGRNRLQNAHATAVRTAKPYRLPGFFGDTVLLPPSLIDWLVKQPKSVLSSQRAQLDFFSTEVTMLNPVIGKSPVHESVIRKGLNGHLSILPVEIIDQLDNAFARVWGTDIHHHREVDLDATISQIVASAANRVFVGKTLAQDERYLKSCISYVHDVSLSAMALNALPTFFRGLFAPVLVIPNRLSHARCLSYLKPYFTQALSDYSDDAASVSSTYAGWSIDHAHRGNCPDIERTPDMLSRRIVAMNFAAVHTSSLATKAFLLDILSDPEMDCLGWLRTELRDSTGAHGSTWDRNRLLKLHRLDSALRESMRLSGFLQRVLLRKVVSPQGVVLPDGTHLSQGTSVCFSGFDIHHDSDQYYDPFNYRYDRFLVRDTTRQTSSPELQHEKAPSPANTTKRSLSKTAAAAQTNPAYLVFGLGKSACPGRFFATDLVKLVVLYAVQHYDLSLVGKRPDHGWMEYHEIPPVGAKLRIKRRERLCGQVT